MNFIKNEWVKKKALKSGAAVCLLSGTGVGRWLVRLTVEGGKSGSYKLGAEKI